MKAGSYHSPVTSRKNQIEEARHRVKAANDFSRFLLAKHDFSGITYVD